MVHCEYLNTKNLGPVQLWQLPYSHSPHGPDLQTLGQQHWHWGDILVTTFSNLQLFTSSTLSSWGHDHEDMVLDIAFDSTGQHLVSASAHGWWQRPGFIHRLQKSVSLCHLSARPHLLTAVSGGINQRRIPVRTVLSLHL